MRQMELSFPATLAHQQLAAIAAANIASSFYRLVTGIRDRENPFINDIELAVGEACTNAVKYCTDPDPEQATVQVCFKMDDREMTVIIKDRNDPFEFDNIPPPDFENVPESGYGIYIMKEKMDQVKYERANDMNIVTMKKTIVQVDNQE